MNKIVAFFMVLLPLMASAQYFELSPDGFVSTEDNTKDFIVIPMEGSQAELYQKAETAVTAMWKSAKDVMSFNEPDIIIVNGFDSGSLWAKHMGMTFVYDFDYRLQLQFKDGKIRINAPGIDKAVNKKSTLYLCKGKGSTMSGTMYVYNEKGELKQKQFKEQAENFVNSIVQRFIDNVKGTSNNDDW